VILNRLILRGEPSHYVGSVILMKFGGMMRDMEGGVRRSNSG
jgi:hypothetical protein